MARRLAPEELRRACDPARRTAGARGADGRFPDGSVNAAVEQALVASAARLTAPQRAGQA